MNGFRPIQAGDHLVVLDASGYVYRAFHALPPLSRRDGAPTGAVSGYCAMLWSLIDDESLSPTHIVAVFDGGGQNHRHRILPEYKANRPPPPPDLLLQFAPVRRATQALGVALVEQRGVEADDIIATYARRAGGCGARVTIISSDKDLRQLIDARTVMFDPMKRAYIDADGVMARMGVGPCHVADFLALMGDTVDNVPGVPGIGEKTAARLIAAHGDVDQILAAAKAGQIKKESTRANLLTYRTSLLLSKELVVLNERVEGLPPIASLVCRQPAVAGFIEFLAEYELAALTARIERGG